MKIELVKNWIMKNAPQLLTTVTVTGTVATCVTSAKAGADSAYDIFTEETRRGSTLTGKEKAKLVWPNFVAPAIVGAVTITSAILSTVIQGRRVDAATALLAGVQQTFSQYQDAVVKKIGEKRNTDIRDEVCRQKVEEQPISQMTVLATGKGDHLMYESISGRYFTSDIESVRAAANDFQADILSGINMSNSLNCWFDALGLKRIRLGEDVGWNIDNPLKVRFSTQLAEDGRPCIVLDYMTLPTDRFNQFY